MRGWIICLAACLTPFALDTAVAADRFELNAIEWSVPGVPEPAAAVVYRLDGRSIKAGPGERVYVSSPERLEPNALPQEIQASAPAAPSWRGQSHPKTRVDIPGYGSRPAAAPAPARVRLAVGREGGDTPRHLDGGGVKIPRAFTFEPDASPVIIPAVTSPGGVMPVRNANVYRRHGGDKQAAEVIDKEPVEPGAVPDNSVMAPPGGGRLYRAEVVLPSTARGIGMGSEYASGR